jgi:acetylglutamate kinase
MTDVPGVNDKNGNLISQLSTKQALDFIDDGTITGGMIPKIKTCISAIESGVNGVVIIDGRKSHAVLFELFSNLGAGTLIVK